MFVVIIIIIIISVSCPQYHSMYWHENIIPLIFLFICHSYLLIWGSGLHSNRIAFAPYNGLILGYRFGSRPILKNEPRSKCGKWKMKKHSSTKSYLRKAIFKKNKIISHRHLLLLHRCSISCDDYIF